VGLIGKRPDYWVDGTHLALPGDAGRHAAWNLASAVELERRVGVPRPVYLCAGDALRA
jgi:hypothetical protein